MIRPPARPEPALLSALLVVGTLSGPALAQVERGPAAALSVRQAIAEALERSPELAGPADTVQLAQINERRASAAFSPRLIPMFDTSSAPLGVTRHNASLALATRLRSGGELSVTGDWSRYGAAGAELRDAGYTVSVTQPLLRGFWETAGADLVNAARAVGGAQRGMRQSADRLVLAVCAAYLEVVRQSHSVDASARARDRAARLRAVSAARAKVGLATELDVLRADVLAGQAQASVGSADEALETARDRLNGLLGRPVGSAIFVGDDAVEQVEQLHGYDWAREGATGADNPSVDDLVNRALSARVDLAETRDAIGDARRAVRLAQWNLMPPIALNVGYTRRGLAGTLPDAYASLWNGWHVGLSTSYGFERSVESAAAAQAHVALGAAEQRARDAAQRVASEVRAAHRAWERARNHVVIQRQAATVAQKQLRLAELRFERGLDGNLDVIDAENNVLQAETALVGAEIDRVLALVSLRVATGALDLEALKR